MFNRGGIIMKIIKIENKKKEFCLEMAYCHQTVTNWPFFHQSKEKVLYIKDFIDFGAEEEI